MANDEKGGRKHGSDGSLLNGSSLSSLTGAVPSAKLEVAVQLPASSLADALERIARLGHTGNLQINFHKGRAQDMRWRTSHDAKAPDV